jgi:hypothetical protein
MQTNDTCVIFNFKRLFSSVLLVKKVKMQFISSYFSHVLNVSSRNLIHLPFSGTQMSDVNYLFLCTAVFNLEENNTQIQNFLWVLKIHVLHNPLHTIDRPALKNCKINLSIFFQNIYPLQACLGLKTHLT